MFTSYTVFARTNLLNLIKLCINFEKKKNSDDKNKLINMRSDYGCCIVKYNVTLVVD